MSRGGVPTGKEVVFSEGDIIVSKTDISGRISYVNQTFIKVSEYQEVELIKQPHAILRHPEMPRCVFKLMWDSIASDKEIFAYVNNLTKKGDHYWVFAHVTPSYDSRGQLIGYHSARRSPRRDAIAKVSELYTVLIAEEEKHKNRKEGMLASFALLGSLLKKQGKTYGEFIFSL